MQRLSTWTPPKQLMGSPDDLIDGIHNSPSLSDYTSRHQPQQARVSSSNEFNAMLEYIQLHTSSKISHIQHEKSKREVDLKNQNRQAEYTNQRLTSEITSLRNNYIKYVSHDEDSKRSMLRIQEKLNRVGTIEFECANKLEMARLTALAEEKKHAEEVQGLKDLLQHAYVRAESMELKSRAQAAEHEEMRVQALSRSARYNGKIMHGALRMILRRLLHRAVCQWRACTGAKVVEVLYTKRLSSLAASSEQTLEKFKSASAIEHKNQIVFLCKEHSNAMRLAEVRLSRVLASRDGMCIRQGRGAGKLRACFGAWKASYIKTVSGKFEALGEEKRRQTQLVSELEAAVAKEGACVEELEGQLLALRKSRLGVVLKLVAARRECALLGRGFGDWRGNAASAAVSGMRTDVAALVAAAAEDAEKIQSLERDAATDKKRLANLQEKCAHYAEYAEVCATYLSVSAICSMANSPNFVPLV